MFIVTVVLILIFKKENDNLDPKRVDQESTLNITQTYALLWKIMKIRPIQMLIIFLLTRLVSKNTKFIRCYLLMECKYQPICSFFPTDQFSTHLYRCSSQAFGLRINRRHTRSADYTTFALTIIFTIIVESLCYRIATHAPVFRFLHLEVHTSTSCRRADFPLIHTCTCTLCTDQTWRLCFRLIFGVIYAAFIFFISNADNNSKITSTWYYWPSLVFLYNFDNVSRTFNFLIHLKSSRASSFFFLVGLTYNDDGCVVRVRSYQ